jgi:4-amino-4-deoxy-L-arabinose transferase-like glycosyltransferase
VLAFLLRVPFFSAPLTADEGGYAEVARLWGKAGDLYSQAWVDRPQGLVLIYRGLLQVTGGSSVGLRAFAAVFAVLTLLATAAIALKLGGRITAAAAAVLFAVAGSSPFVESFTLAGELLAALPAALSLGLFLVWRERGDTRWLVAAGAFTGCAVLIKQSAFDAGLAAILWLWLTERRRARRPITIFVAGALAPVLAAAAWGGTAWWSAVVGYRFQGDSIVTGSPGDRLHLLWLTLPALAKGLGLLVLLAAYGWRRAPLLARLWLLGALLGVVGGGNFHAHYYLQLVPPLSLLAAYGAAPLLEGRRRMAAAAAAAAAVTTIALALPLWLASPPAQARGIWPHDPHLATDAKVAAYIRAHTKPGEPIAVLWAAADIYDLAQRPPAVHYLWKRNIQSIPGALVEVREQLAGGAPTLVAVVQGVEQVDPNGATAAILQAHYELIADIDGVPIWRSLRAAEPR